MPVGQIKITANAQGKRLDLMGPNPSPPPERVSTWSCDPIPAWMWEAVQGNAGQPCVVTLDAQGNPSGVTVG